MASQSFRAIIGSTPVGQAPFITSAQPCDDLSGLAGSADTLAATGTTDVAALIATAGSAGLTGTLVASVTLTSVQGNGIITAMNLVSTDLAAVKTATAKGVTALAAPTNGVSVVNVQIAPVSATTQGGMRAALSAITNIAGGSGVSK